MTKYFLLIAKNLRRNVLRTTLTALGTMVLVDANGTLSQPLSGMPAIAAQGQVGLLDVALDVPDCLAGILLIPESIQGFGDQAELHQEVAREVLRLGLSTFFPPEAHQGRLIGPHNDPSIRTADERASILAHPVFPEVPEAIL